MATREDHHYRPRGSARAEPSLRYTPGLKRNFMRDIIYRQSVRNVLIYLKVLHWEHIHHSASVLEISAIKHSAEGETTQRQLFSELFGWNVVERWICWSLNHQLDVYRSPYLPHGFIVVYRLFVHFVQIHFQNGNENIYIYIYILFSIWNVKAQRKWIGLFYSYSYTSHCEWWQILLFTQENKGLITESDTQNRNALCFSLFTWSLTLILMQHTVNIYRYIHRGCQKICTF